MDAVLQLTPQDRRLACLQVEARMRRQAARLAKDFWVCWTLRELTAAPGLRGGGHAAFSFSPVSRETLQAHALR